jgi:tripartite-type tricarboxylate transporter receptor subunit TctC
MLNSRRKRFGAQIFAPVFAVLAAHAACAQDFPSRPIRLVSAPVGSGSDVVSRIVAAGLSGSVGQQVIVDNRSGDIIPGEIVSRAPPDGYTLNFTGGGFWLVPFLYSNVPWDPVKDFTPITLAAGSPNVLAVHPSVAATSVKELIALAKAKPGQLNYGSSGAGGSSHLSAELFNSMAGVNIVRVPYKGSGPLVTDLIGGQVQLAFPAAASVSGHVKAGKLRGLAVTSAQPSALVLGLPTVASAGLPGYESATNYGVFAPAKTPAAVIARLNQEIVRALNRPDVKERFTNVGAEGMPGTPEQLAAKVRSDMDSLGRLIRDKGIRAE